MIFRHIESNDYYKDYLILLEQLTIVEKEKIILDCNEKNVNFYQNSGFKQKEIQMVKYL